MIYLEWTFSLSHSIPFSLRVFAVDCLHLLEMFCLVLLALGVCLLFSFDSISLRWLLLFFFFWLWNWSPPSFCTAHQLWKVFWSSLMNASIGIAFSQLLFQDLSSRCCWSQSNFHYYLFSLSFRVRWWRFILDIWFQFLLSFNDIQYKFSNQKKN